MLPNRFNNSKFPMIACLLALVIFSAITGCSFKKPESPSWITTWDIPISNKTYDVAELLENLNDSLFITDSLGNPAFTINQNIDTFSVGNNLTYQGVSASMVDSVGTIDIAAPSNQATSTDLTNFLPVSLGVVPPAPFNYDQAAPALDKFTWLEIQSGTLDLQFYNALEVDLDTFVVTVIDQADMHTVGVATYVNGLSYLETETQSIDLSGQRISNNLTMNFDGYTSGGVLLSSGPQTIDATMSFPSNVTVTAAQAETPAINIAKSISTILPDSTTVTSSVVGSGTLQYDISNYTQITFNVDITSNNFTYGGNPLQTSRIISPGTTQVTVDLAGYQFAPTISGPDQTVDVDFTAYAPPSAPVQNTVSASDSVTVDAVLSSITFESITGQVRPTVVAIDPMQQNVDIPQGMDQARLTMAVLNLNLYNNSMVPADVDLVISGGGNVLNVSDRVEGKTSIQSPARLTTITVGSDQLADFLNPPPSTITISGQALMNPDYGVATITANDNFYGDFEIYSPFAVAITDTVAIDLDISEAEIDSSSRPDDFATTFKYGAIDVEFNSHLPLGVQLTLYIGTISDSTLYTDPGTLVLGPYTLEPGVTDNNGQVIESSISTIADSLDNNELSVFDNNTIYFGKKVNLLPTDSTGIQLLGTDYINIKSNARIQVQVGDNLWNNQ